MSTAGGFDFSDADCVTWMEKVGFRDINAEPLGADPWMAARFT